MGKEKIKEYLNNKIGIETVMVQNEINSDKELKMCQSILDYIEQLEEREKKIKGKLKDDIKNANNNLKHMEGRSILQVISKGLTEGMRDYAEEILNLYNDKEE